MKTSLRNHLITLASAVAVSQLVTLGVFWTSGQAYLERKITAGIETGVFAKERAEKQAWVDAQFARYGRAADQVPNDARVYGDLKARFTLAEFSDLECPFCKRLQPSLKEIVDKSNGAVNWQWRHMPLGFHNPAATDEAIATECYAEQKGNRGFWVILDQIFEESAGNGGGVKDLPGLVSRLGADMKVFNQCISSGKVKDRIADHIRMGEKIGATGTPATIVIDNLTGEKEFVSGAQPISAFVTIMKRMLAAEQAAAKAEADKAQGKPQDQGDEVSRKILGFGSAADSAQPAK
ncbi:DsbA family protein [Pseudomonas sp. CBMAI 2609]|uniref:DsbA family protein n=1 Tax=Pseudomonas flavocrustae TaxID=2991719 RepID=A0ABT6IJR5_9PSED|nr:DsbA family protein [Pseudomonas sp. CBMAI 2609]MDH4764294.1 DsbA family protein [Pseudomonas sp. CBMAI 2609]